MTSLRFHSIASRLARLALRIMPPGQREWGSAMLHEVEAVEPGPGAVLFALECVRGALVAAALDRKARLSAKLKLALFSTPGHLHMDTLIPPRARDLMVGILCAAGAVGMGVIYMATGGAPSRLIIVNIAALVLGAGLCLVLAQSWLLRDGWVNKLAPALGLILLGVAILGARADGAARWVDLAGLVVQPTLLFAPLMLMLHARRRDAWTSAGLALAIVATAMQPDRAMAGVIVGALAVLALRSRARSNVLLTVAAATGFVVTVLRPDHGGVSPFVDQILFTSFEIHPLVGAGLALGAMLLIVPAALQVIRSQNPSIGMVFGAVWSLVVLAALMGNYPTPLVGYGGSAIVGYLLSLAVLGAIAIRKPGHAASNWASDVEGDAGNRRMAIEV